MGIKFIYDDQFYQLCLLKSTKISKRLEILISCLNFTNETVKCLFGACLLYVAFAVSFSLGIFTPSLVGDNVTSWDKINCESDCFPVLELQKEWRR